MSNPGTRVGSVSINALSVAVPSGFILFIITLLLFQFKKTLSYFTIIVWLGLPIIGFLVATGMNAASQAMYCADTDSGKAFTGAIPSLFAVLIGLAISSISFCRIPVASVIAPLFVTDSTKPMPSLETLEDTKPMVSGFAYGFYLFFSMMFGIVLGSGSALAC